MSSISSSHSRGFPKHLEICVGSISNQTEPHTLLTYFEQFGKISHYNFSTPDGRGYVFITYEDRKDVDRCIANRPHRLDGRHLYVKRALPYDSEHPREHVDSTRDMMILIDSFEVDEQFLRDLREYFSSYGTLYACKCCHEEYFDYILVEFADFDQVDRILLDKPHYFNQQKLNLMKLTSSNKALMNIKYSSNESHSIIKDAIDVEDDGKCVKYEVHGKKDRRETNVSEIDLENEVLRLQNVLKKMNRDFSVQRQQLEDDCCEQLRKLNENADQTHRLQQDLEQEYAKLLVEYESLKRENEVLNEQYLMAELENFELTSYYEQILAEEKAKTAEYEMMYTEKLQNFSTNRSPSASSPRLQSLSTSPLPPAIPDDD